MNILVLGGAGYGLDGFGFGIAEAVVFGKPVIATAYSGNMEFMNADIAIA